MDLRNRFLDYLRYELYRSEHTVTGYGDDLASFEAYFKQCDEELTWQSVDADVIRNWMESMMDKGNSATSINRRLSAVRMFFRFALSRKLVSRDPAHDIVGPKRKQPIPQFVKEQEMDELLQPHNWDAGYAGQLERTIVMTFYETGVRLSELIGLKDVDVDFGERQVKVTGKGNKQRVIPFGEGLELQLRHYQALRNSLVGTGAKGSFFLGKEGRVLTPEWVRQMVKRRLTGHCTLAKRSPHVLRHTFATAMLNHEAGLESLKQLLGHVNLSTTEIYTHTTFEQLKRVYSKAHPRA